MINRVQPYNIFKFGTDPVRYRWKGAGVGAKKGKWPPSQSRSWSR